MSVREIMVQFLFLSLIALTQPFTLSGTMHHTTLEGGCWYLQADGGKHYELVGDTEIVNPLHVDGQHIAVRVEPSPGMASICMVGEIVRVIARIDTTRYPIDLPITPMNLEGTVHRTKSGIWYIKTSNGRKYEFQKTLEKPFDHVGASFSGKYRVLLNKATNQHKMDGVILPGPQRMKQKSYDSR